jgi:RNAse (barnase) inhibitor barstar
MGLEWQQLRMQLIRLDAAGWRSPDDFYSALLPELGAPDWHGRNLNALYDSLMGDINSLEPPFEIEIEGAAELPQNMKAFLDEVISVFEDARAEFGADVSLKIC